MREQTFIEFSHWIPVQPHRVALQCWIYLKTRSLYLLVRIPSDYDFLAVPEQPFYCICILYRELRFSKKNCKHYLLTSGAANITAHVVKFGVLRFWKNITENTTHKFDIYMLLQRFEHYHIRIRNVL